MLPAPAPARTTRKQLRAVVPLAQGQPPQPSSEPDCAADDCDFPSRSVPIRIPKPEWQRTLEALGHQIEQVRTGSLDKYHDRNDAPNLYARTDNDRAAVPPSSPVRSSRQSRSSSLSSRSSLGLSSGSSHGVCVAPWRSDTSAVETVLSSSSSSPASEAYYSAVFSLESDSSRSSQCDLITAHSSLSSLASPSSLTLSSSVPTDAESEPEQDTEDRSAEHSPVWVHLGVRFGTVAPARGGAVRLAVSLVVSS